MRRRGDCSGKRYVAPRVYNSEESRKYYQNKKKRLQANAEANWICFVIFNNVNFRLNKVFRFENHLTVRSFSNFEMHRRMVNGAADFCLQIKKCRNFLTPKNALFAQSAAWFLSTQLHQDMQQSLKCCRMLLWFRYSTNSLFLKFSKVWLLSSYCRAMASQRRSASSAQRKFRLPTT